MKANLWSGCHFINHFLFFYFTSAHSFFFFLFKCAAIFSALQCTLTHSLARSLEGLHALVCVCLLFTAYLFSSTFLYLLTSSNRVPTSFTPPPFLPYYRSFVTKPHWVKQLKTAFFLLQLVVMGLLSICSFLQSISFQLLLLSLQSTTV